MNEKKQTKNNIVNSSMETIELAENKSNLDEACSRVYSISSESEIARRRESNRLASQNS